MSKCWSAHTRLAMQEAGWFPGRNVSEDVQRWSQYLAERGFAIFDRAESALREFGGLRVDAFGPGRDCARTSFVLDPCRASGEDDRFALFEPNVGGRLYPLGEIGDHHAYLAMSEDGRVFVLMDALVQVGASMEEAIDALIEGKRMYGGAQEGAG